MRVNAKKVELDGETWQAMRRANTTDHVGCTHYGIHWNCLATTVSSRVFFTIPGVVPSLKNRRRMFKSPRTGKMFPAKSEAASRYMRDFCLIVPAEYRGFQLGGKTEPLRAFITAYYPNYRSDVDVEIVWDCLQAAGVVSNDRWIRQKLIYGEIDAKNPRCEVILETL